MSVCIFYESWHETLKLRWVKKTYNFAFLLHPLMESNLSHTILRFNPHFDNRT